MTLRRFSTSSLSTGTKSHKLWDGETFPGYFESIATVVVGSAGAANVEFTNIPQNYSHLQIRATHQEPTDSIQLQFNDVTSNVYTNHSFLGDGGVTTSAYTSQSLSQFGIVFGTNYGSSGSNFGVSICDILDYSNTNKGKVIRSLTGAENNTSFSRIGFYSGWYSSNLAITKIKIFPRTSGFNIAQYSHFALYGIRSA